MTRKRTQTFTLSLLAVAVFVTGAWAQQPQQQPNPLVAGMAANAKQLKEYRFKQRTETYHDGELKSSKTEEIFYASNGERVSIPLEERVVPTNAPRRGPGHRMVARKIESEKEKMKEYIERMVTLTGRYLPPDPALLVSAKMVKGENDARMVLRNYVKDGDTMTLIFDPATKKATKVEVSTTLEDTPVNISLVMEQIHEGPTGPGRMVIRSQAKQLELRVFMYDYRL